VTLVTVDRDFQVVVIAMLHPEAVLTGVVESNLDLFDLFWYYLQPDNTVAYCPLEADASNYLVY